MENIYCAAHTYTWGGEGKGEKREENKSGDI